MSDEERAHTPSAIRQSGPRELTITWQDGRESVYAVRDLPDDVRPVKIEPVGRYALQIQWSDGHETGIYPFRRLRELDGG